eukprot:8934171-Pyramimonas_sp.AAC.1
MRRGHHPSRGQAGAGHGRQVREQLRKVGLLGAPADGAPVRQGGPLRQLAFARARPAEGAPALHRAGAGTWEGHGAVRVLAHLLHDVPLLHA